MPGSDLHDHNCLTVFQNSSSYCTERNTQIGLKKKIIDLGQENNTLAFWTITMKHASLKRHPIFSAQFAFQDKKSFYSPLKPNDVWTTF